MITDNLDMFRDCCQGPENHELEKIYRIVCDL